MMDKDTKAAVKVAQLKYRTEGGVEGTWAVANANLHTEADARAYLAHHHPAYSFVGVEFETRGGGGVVTK